MFAFLRKDPRRDVVDLLHGRIVAQSREPALYGPDLLPDTIEGRFESLTLHVILVLRRLRHLPAPADDIGQDLVDRVFAHLEIALRELGVGDFGVPKRMKKIAGAFYDRVRLYDPLLDAKDGPALAAELAQHLNVANARIAPFAEHALAIERQLADCDLNGLLEGGRFAFGTTVTGQEALR